MTPESLDDALGRLRIERPLLVGVDFDGVLAPIVQQPMAARPMPGSMAALEALAGIDGVSVVLVSGRALDVLAQLSGASDPVLLVGSHGAQMPAGASASDLLDDVARLRLKQVREKLESVAAQYPQAFVETKPTSAVLHTRPLAADDAASATAGAVAVLADLPGVHVMRGKQVVEAAVLEASKGAAIARLRDQVGAAAVLYLGDDVTDETVFTTLLDGDMGVKVGAGPTAAVYRVADPAAVRDLLQQLHGLLAAPRG